MNVHRSRLLRIGRPICGGLVLLCASAAFAQVDAGLPDLPIPAPPKLPEPATFAAEQLRAFDADRNDKVTWAEFSARLRKAFNEMDRKRRGYLTKDDFQAAYEKALAAVPSRPQPE